MRLGGFPKENGTDQHASEGPQTRITCDINRHALSSKYYNLSEIKINFSSGYISCFIRA